MDQEVAKSCVRWLRHWMSKQKIAEADDKQHVGTSLAETIRKEYEKNPEEWWVGHHFQWGMQMRNLLRENGYGEKELGVGNLDDCYIELIENAIGCSNTIS